MNGLRKYSAFFTSSSRDIVYFWFCALNFIYFYVWLFCMAAILSYLDNEVSVLKTKQKDLHSLFLETNSLEDIDSLLLDFSGTQCNTTVLHDIIEIFSDRNALIHFLHLISRNSEHCTKR
eukprot:UN10282